VKLFSVGKFVICKFAPFKCGKMHVRDLDIGDLTYRCYGGACCAYIPLLWRGLLCLYTVVMEGPIVPIYRCYGGAYCAYIPLLWMGPVGLYTAVMEGPVVASCSFNTFSYSSSPEAKYYSI
jgi:hypothetical protein